MDPSGQRQDAFAGERRRFEGEGQLGRPGVLAVVASLAVVAGFATVSAALPRAMYSVVVPVLVVAGLGGYGVVLSRMLRSRKVILDIDRDQLVVDEGRGGAFPLASAVLGPWRQPGLGVIAGTVLHLVGSRRLRIGGRDHQASRALLLDAPPEEDVDLYLPAADFEALLACLPSAALGVRAGVVEASATAAPALLRCPLLANPSSARSVLGMMAPWFGTMALTMLLSAVFGALGVFDKPGGQIVVLPITLVILVGGIVVTMVRAQRRAPALQIEVDGRELRLLDPKTGRILSAALLGGVIVTRGMHRMLTRSGSFEYPLLVIRIPGRAELTVGVYDGRFAWGGGARYLSAPRYIVGPPDWHTLVDRLGARSFLVVRQGSG